MNDNIVYFPQQKSIIANECRPKPAEEKQEISLKLTINFNKILHYALFAFLGYMYGKYQ